MLLSSCLRFFSFPSSSSNLVFILTPRLTAVPLLPVRTFKRRPPKQGKPPILPPSKKLLYTVYHREWMKPEDVREQLWRRITYNNALTSLFVEIAKEVKADEIAGRSVAGMKEAEDDELNALLAKNEERNREAARLRAERDAEETKKAALDMLSEIEAELSKREEVVKESTKEILDMVERSKHFVTVENLDAKLQEALENPVVYDYAIDLQGKRMYNPPPTKYLEGTPTRQKGRLYDKTLGEVIPQAAHHP